MNRLIWTFALLTLTGVAVGETRTFTTEASDGVVVHGEVYTATGVDPKAPLILLFHQGAGDSRGEYTPLVPRLLDEGYNLVAIDQRRGGDRFEGVNRTLAGVPGREFSYCDVMPDLRAALPRPLRGASPLCGRSSSPISSSVQSTTARSIAFSSSRTFPGHG